MGDKSITVQDETALMISLSLVRPGGCTHIRCLAEPHRLPLFHTLNHFNVSNYAISTALSGRPRHERRLLESPHFLTHLSSGVQ